MKLQQTFLMKHIMDEPLCVNNLLIPIPKTMYLHTVNEKKEIIEYLKQLNETQLKTYLLAVNQLGSSFNIYKSNGFKEWKSKLNFKD